MPPPPRRPTTTPALALLALLLLAVAGAQPDLAPRALEADELDAATVRRAAVRFEVDTIVYDVLNETGVPGVVVALAWGGEVIAAEAYGTADAATGRALTLDDPLWVASITKTPVAIAVLALATQGRLDLDAPLDTMLAQALPPPPPGDATPLTARHLLTHTGGFDGRLLNTILPEPGPNPLLSELALPARIEPAGSGPRYGNAGHHALGLLLEAVTGTDVETALRELVFAPLGMNSARLLRPTDAAYDAVTVPGHTRSATGQLRPAAPLTLRDPTAGQLRLSGSDVALLLAALTAESPPAPLADGVRAALLTTAARARPLVPGTTLGMWEGHLLGHEVVLQGGDLPGLHSLLLIVPDAGVALFVHVNGPVADDDAGWSTTDGLRDVRWLLAERLVARFVSDARAPAEAVAADRLPDDARAAPGVYRPTSVARTGPEALLLLGGLAQLRVTVDAEGAVVVWTPPHVSPERRYLPTPSGVYRREGGGDVLGASRGPRGEPLLHGELGMPLTLERVPPLERLEFLIGSASAALAAAAAALLGWPLGAWRRWRAREPRGREPGRPLVALRWTARLQALATLAWLAIVLLMIDAAQPALAIDLDAWWAASTAAWALLAITALTLTLAGTVLAVRGDDSTSAAPRLRPRATFHALLGLAGLALALQGWVWRLAPWG